MIAEDAVPTDIKAGAETIDMQEGSPNGVLLLHGFGDTPQTLRLLAEYLHARGHDVVAPLLPGHGRNVTAFMQSRRAEWLSCARSEFVRLQGSHETVSVAGLSMGGALASIVAAENPGIASLSLISPYLTMPVTHRVASALHFLWGPAAGARPSSSPRSILDPEERAKNLGYGVYSGRLLYELGRLASDARRNLSRITVPTLLIQSRADPRISPSVAIDALGRLHTSDKRLVWAEGGGHIITVDYGRERVFEEVGGWIDSHTPPVLQRTREKSQ
jgi:carboxylesterase